MISLTLVGLFLTLAACGGGGGTGDSTNIGSGTTAPPPTTAPPSNTPPSSTPPSSGGGDICFMGFNWMYCDDLYDSISGGSNGAAWITPIVYGIPDTEPNNSITTPSQAGLPSGVQNGERRGFLVEGTINSVSDPADVFVFTPIASANIEFTLCFTERLCSKNTGDRIEVGTAYISVLDQDGAVVWSASDFPYPGNIATFWLEAGLPYYLMVTGEDTMGSDLAYRLHVVEAQTQVRKSPPQPPEPEYVSPDAPVLSGWESGGSNDSVTIELNWSAPTENEDGTTFSDLSGYVIYYGPLSGGIFTHSIKLDNPGLVTYLIDLPRDDWAFAITALDSEELEGPLSNVVHVSQGPNDGSP
jgi:hypothetical protein